MILVAAGQGTRLKADQPKALVHLGGAPVVTHAVRGVLDCPDVAHVVVVGPASSMASLAESVAAAPLPEGCGLTLVPGGPHRADSVAVGLAAMPVDVGIVLVHDAARALTPPEVFERVVHAVRQGHSAVVPAVPVTDTVKQVEADAAGVEHVVATLARGALRAVQTPQGFLRETLEHAYTAAGSAPAAQASATDDAALVEAIGGRVTVVPGHPRALKITTAQDLRRAEHLLGAGAPVLVVLAGRPGVGKTTVARSLARVTGWAHLRLDTVEQALLRAGAATVGVEGYAVLYAVAADQLAAGRSVVADSVGWVAEIRQAWRDVADRAGVRLLEVELGVADVAEHRRRVQTRVADIEGHRLPDWGAASSAAYEPWDGEHVLRLDTGTAGTAEVVDAIRAAAAR